MISTVLQAVGLFVATNIDDIIVISLFFARGAGQRHLTAKITAGQYFGFAGILAVAVLIALGAGAFLPVEAIPYFGLVPLVLGLRAAWSSWREYRDNDGDDDSDGDSATGKGSGNAVGVLGVAGVTFANGGDNIGVYVPVFVNISHTAIAAYCVVFLILVGALVYIARFVATRRSIAEILEQWESVLFPLVLITLGVVILVSGGAFGL
ncbi:cadmium resistance transporter [Tsukamurella sp. USMM236]|uniref:cadmium resistance transporter n=1 Tax=Tsukamurella sp. USMM236 TaxID=3081301 RepID=UPI003017C245